MPFTMVGFKEGGSSFGMTWKFGSAACLTATSSGSSVEESQVHLEVG